MNSMRTALLLFGSATAAMSLPQCGERELPRQESQDPVPANADRLRLCVSGTLEGRLEPCGCASGQLGGLARRAFHLGNRKDYDLRIEGGDLVSDGSELDLEKYYTAIEILFQGRLPYHALGLGPRDLTLEYATWSGLMQAYGVPLVSADLVAPDGDETWPARPFVEHEVRGRKVRITGFTMTLPDAANGLPELRVLPPAEAWKRALEGASPEALRVLMVHADDEVARKLASELQPRPDLVLGISRTHTEPPAQADKAGDVPVVYPGIRGRMLLDLALVRTAEGPRLTTYHIVPLQGSETRRGAMEDDDVKQAILRHRFQVRDDKVLQKMASQRPTANGAEYVGSQRCQSCHQEDYEIWQESKHAKAWETLEVAEKDPARYGWPVTAYPDCVSCHVVGYGEKSGFIDMATTPGLAAVGCEQCHGPASKHVQSPAEFPLGKVGAGFPATVCTRCHDFEQSPEFDYGAKWKLIEHGYK